eukprot:Nk52_evm36s295 gene=Nk52_evmTU36s295
MCTEGGNSRASCRSQITIDSSSSSGRIKEWAPFTEEGSIETEEDEKVRLSQKVVHCVAEHTRSLPPHLKWYKIHKIRSLPSHIRGGRHLVTNKKCLEVTFSRTEEEKLNIANALSTPEWNLLEVFEVIPVQETFHVFMELPRRMICITDYLDQYHEHDKEVGASFLFYQILCGVQILQSKGIYEPVCDENIWVVFDVNGVSVKYSPLLSDARKSDAAKVIRTLSEKNPSNIDYKQNEVGLSLGLLLHKILFGTSLKVVNGKPVVPNSCSIEALEVLKILLGEDGGSKDIGHLFGLSWFSKCAKRTESKMDALLSKPSLSAEVSKWYCISQQEILNRLKRLPFDNAPVTLRILFCSYLLGGEVTLNLELLDRNAKRLKKYVRRVLEEEESKFQFASCVDERSVSRDQNPCTMSSLSEERLSRKPDDTDTLKPWEEGANIHPLFPGQQIYPGGVLEKVSQSHKPLTDDNTVLATNRDEAKDCTIGCFGKSGQSSRLISSSSKIENDTKTRRPKFQSNRRQRRHSTGTNLSTSCPIDAASDGSSYGTRTRRMSLDNTPMDTRQNIVRSLSEKSQRENSIRPSYCSKSRGMDIMYTSKSSIVVEETEKESFAPTEQYKCKGFEEKSLTKGLISAFGRIVSSALLVKCPRISERYTCTVNTDLASTKDAIRRCLEENCIESSYKNFIFKVKLESGGDIMKGEIEIVRPNSSNDGATFALHVRRSSGDALKFKFLIPLLQTYLEKSS